MSRGAGCRQFEKVEGRRGTAGGKGRRFGSATCQLAYRIAGNVPDYLFDWPYPGGEGLAEIETFTDRDKLQVPCESALYRSNGRSVGLNLTCQ